MFQEVMVKKVEMDAKDFFRTERFYCSEAIVASIRKNIVPQMPEAVIATASGFSAGVGQPECMCSALTGAIISLGYLFGRTNPSSPHNRNSVRCMRLAYELIELFRSKHNCTLRCRVYIVDASPCSDEYKSQCEVFIGEIAAKTAEIIFRELGSSVAQIV